MILENILKDIGTGFLSLEKVFNFGPQGKLLKKNFQDLWYKYCVVMPPYNVFLSSSDKVNETFDILEKIGVHSQKPLGICIFDHCKGAWNTDLILNENSKLSSHKIGKVTIITDPSEGKDLYHRKQRERKVWWRKFSKEPKRFHLNEAKRINKNKEIIEIVADFSFGSVVVETITYQQDVRKIFKEQIDNEKNPIGIHTVDHTASIDWGCLAFLCDAYSNLQEEDSCQLQLHPKLSPYKVAICILTTTDQDQDGKSQEKFRLLLYLNNLLKSKGIETVITTNIIGIKALQVPLIVTIDDTTLQNGIIKVSSRQTALSESVHMTDLVKYVSIRCS